MTFIKIILSTFLAMLIFVLIGILVCFIGHELNPFFIGAKLGLIFFTLYVIVYFIILIIQWVFDL